MALFLSTNCTMKHILKSRIDDEKSIKTSVVHYYSFQLDFVNRYSIYKMENIYLYFYYSCTDIRTYCRMKSILNVICTLNSLSAIQNNVHV